MSSDESIWRMRVLSTSMPEYVGELVRCKDCALYDREDGLCYRDPNHSGYYRPAHDGGFCAWAKKREEPMSDSELYTIELGGDIGDIATMHRLVRCKECRHMHEHEGTCGIQLLCDLHTCFHVGPEGFCSWAEPIEDGDGDA